MNDLPVLAPSGVTVVFPATRDGVPLSEFYAYSVPLGSLQLVQYRNMIGVPWDRTINRYETATFVANSGLPSNLPALTGLSKQVATDWYSWQLGKLDQQFAGIVTEDPGAFHDREWRQEHAQIKTLVSVKDEKREDLNAPGVRNDGCADGFNGTKTTYRTECCLGGWQRTFATDHYYCNGRLLPTVDEEYLAYMCPCDAGSIGSFGSGGSFGSLGSFGSGTGSIPTGSCATMVICGGVCMQQTLCIRLADVADLLVPPNPCACANDDYTVTWDGDVFGLYWGTMRFVGTYTVCGQTVEFEVILQAGPGALLTWSFGLTVDGSFLGGATSATPCSAPYPVAFRYSFGPAMTCGPSAFDVTIAPTCEGSIGSGGSTTPPETCAEVTLLGTYNDVVAATTHTEPNVSVDAGALLIVAVMTVGATHNPTGVTWGGIPMTPIAGVASLSSHVNLYYYDNSVAAASGDVVVTYAAARACSMSLRQVEGLTDNALLSNCAASGETGNPDTGALTNLTAECGYALAVFGLCVPSGSSSPDAPFADEGQDVLNNVGDNYLLSTDYVSEELVATTLQGVLSSNTPNDWGALLAVFT